MPLTSGDILQYIMYHYVITNICLQKNITQTNKQLPHVGCHISHHVSKGVKGAEGELDEEAAEDGKDPFQREALEAGLHLVQGFTTPLTPLHC